MPNASGDIRHTAEAFSPYDHVDFHGTMVCRSALPGTPHPLAAAPSGKLWRALQRRQRTKMAAQDDQPAPTWCSALTTLRAGRQDLTAVPYDGWATLTISAAGRPTYWRIVLPLLINNHPGPANAQGRSLKRYTLGLSGCSVRTGIRKHSAPRIDQPRKSDSQ